MATQQHRGEGDPHARGGAAPDDAEGRRDDYAADRMFVRVIGLVLLAESLLIAWLLAR